MESYAYRETLEDVLAWTGGKRVITVTEATAYLGFKDIRAVRKRCPKTFANGWGMVTTFAKEISDTTVQRRKRK